MPYPTPATPTLADISTNDFINYQGVLYPITTVVEAEYDELGHYEATITISVASPSDVTLNLSEADTIVSATTIDANGVAHTTWSQTSPTTDDDDISY